MAHRDRITLWLCTLLCTSAVRATARAQSFLYMDRNGAMHTLHIDESTEGRPFADNEEAFPYAAIAAEAARAHAVPLQLLRAVMAVESSFQPGARSRAGACGLMQLMPATAAELGVSDPFDPRQNVMAAARMLRQLLDRFSGRLRLVIAAYNAGPAAVLRADGVPPYPQTERYVRRVLALYAAWTDLAPSRRRGAT